MMRVEIQRKHGPEIVDLNRRKAIHERCLNCAGWIHKEVTECEFDDCDLYPFRYGKGKQDAKKRAMAIRKYCLWCCVDQPKEVRLCPARDCPLFPYRQSTIDKSVEVGASSKKHHIEAISEDKTSDEYHESHVPALSN
jgi:hypothetical protein